jgi:anthranilate phosphoribosyltransferase
MEIKDCIDQLVKGKSLSQKQMVDAAESIMNGSATNAQTAAFLVALRMKGETSDEISGLAIVMREKSLHPQISDSINLLDTCGTGGDGSGTFNVSTASAIVAASAGIRVAKHGGRAISSKCGSGDLLESVGVKIDLGPEGVAECVNKIGIGFMYAFIFHPAMRLTNDTRREIGIRTIFNIVGPLTNPANAGHQLVGVPSPDLVPVITDALQYLGTKKAIVVHGEGPMDEISLCGTSIMGIYTDGTPTKIIEIDPQDYGLKLVKMEQIQSETVESSKRILIETLKGAKGPYRDFVLINSAAALLAAENVENLYEGVEKAKHILDSGEGLSKLQEFANLSQSLA